MDPTLTYTESGLFSGDTLTGSLSRASGENVGAYPIASTLANLNYEISYTPADFAITKSATQIAAE